MTCCLTARDLYFDYQRGTPLPDNLLDLFISKTDFTTWRDYGKWRQSEGEKTHWLYGWDWGSFFKFLDLLEAEWDKQAQATGRA